MEYNKQPPSPFHASKPWLTKSEAAAYAGVSQKTIDRLRAQDQLRTYLIAGTRCLRFRREDLDKLIQ